MDFKLIDTALQWTTGIRRIFSNSATGVWPAFYRSCAFIFSVVTGVERMFYRNLTYVFPANTLRERRFLKHILLTMMLKKLKTSPPELMLLFCNGGLDWK